MEFISYSLNALSSLDVNAHVPSGDIRTRRKKFEGVADAILRCRDGRVDVSGKNGCMKDCAVRLDKISKIDVFDNFPVSPQKIFRPLHQFVLLTDLERGERDMNRTESNVPAIAENVEVNI